MFKINIGSLFIGNTKPDLSDQLNQDLNLIKAALLYADLIEICSPVGNLVNNMNSVKQYATASLDEKRSIALKIANQISHPQFQVIANDFSNKSYSEKQIDKLMDEFYNNILEFVNSDHLMQILIPVEKKLVKYYLFNHSHEHTYENIFDQFTAFLSGSILDPASYPLLDLNEFTSFKTQRNTKQFTSSSFGYKILRSC